jgi:hypothetical protein
MKKTLIFLGVILFTSIILFSCGSKVTVCDCLKDDGSHKKECDELGNSMSSDEINNAIIQCK